MRSGSSCHERTALDRGRQRLGGPRPELVGEEGAVLLERPQGLGRPPRVRERTHRLSPGTVTERLLRDARLDERDGRGPIARVEQDLDEILDRAGRQLCEPARLGHGPVLVRELRACVAVPAVECLRQGSARAVAIGSGAAEELLEVPCVDVATQSVRPGQPPAATRCEDR
jgi:hypothetical protein